nr:MAG TPA: hypothetical protein [Caudoviricetes sp.]
MTALLLTILEFEFIIIIELRSRDIDGHLSSICT